MQLLFKRKLDNNKTIQTEAWIDDIHGRVVLYVNKSYFLCHAGTVKERSYSQIDLNPDLIQDLNTCREQKPDKYFIVVATPITNNQPRYTRHWYRATYHPTKHEWALLHDGNMWQQLPQPSSETCPTSE